MKSGNKFHVPLAEITMITYEKPDDPQNHNGRLVLFYLKLRLKKNPQNIACFFFPKAKKTKSFRVVALKPMSKFEMVLKLACCIFLF